MAMKPDTGHAIGPQGAESGAVVSSISNPLAIRPESETSAVLAPEDIAIYKSQLPNWREHQGEHVLIHGGAVHGFYPSRQEARREGLRRFGPVAFVVKQVDVDEKPRTLAAVIR